MNKNVWKKQSQILRALSRHAIRKGSALPINWPAKQVYNLTMSIFRQVHKAVDGELAKVRQAEDFMSRGNSIYMENSPEMYNNVSAMRKYNHIYSNGKIDRTDLATENSPEFALVKRAAQLAEDIKEEKIAAVIS
jgi:hypothetical protein